MTDCDELLNNLLKITDLRRKLENIRNLLEPIVNGREKLGVYIPMGNYNCIKEIIRILRNAEKNILFQMYEYGCITPEV